MKFIFIALLLLVFYAMLNPASEQEVNEMLGTGAAIEERAKAKEARKIADTIRRVEVELNK